MIPQEDGGWVYVSNSEIPIIADECTDDPSSDMCAEQGGAGAVRFDADGNVIDAYSPELSLFAMLESLPLAAITSTIGVILVIVFFVTSSDSGSLVIDTITAGGKVDAPVPQRVFWCTFEGLVAIVLLIGGGLSSLQAMVISTGLPFTLVLLLMCVAIFRGLQTEER